MAWAIWFCKTQADFKICLPHKAVLEIYLVFCPIPRSAEYFGFTASKLELGRPQDVYYSCQSIQVFGYKFCSLGRLENSRHFNLLESVNFLAGNQEHGRPENPMVLSLM